MSLPPPQIHPQLTAGLPMLLQRSRPIAEHCSEVQRVISSVVSQLPPTGPVELLESDVELEEFVFELEESSVLWLDVVGFGWGCWLGLDWSPLLFDT